VYTIHIIKATKINIIIQALEQKYNLLRSRITYELHHCHGQCYDKWTNKYHAAELHFAIKSVEYF